MPTLAEIFWGSGTIEGFWVAGGFWVIEGSSAFGVTVVSEVCVVEVFPGFIVHSGSFPRVVSVFRWFVGGSGANASASATSPAAAR
jgi:hypothetical protein